VLVYWLIASLIIIVMIGVLAAADSMSMPVRPLLSDMTAVSILPLLLVALAIILILITKFNIPSAKFSYLSKKSSSYPVGCSVVYPKPFIRIVNRVLVVILAIGLVVGSAMQAIVSHQQA